MTFERFLLIIFTVVIVSQSLFKSPTVIVEEDSNKIEHLLRIHDLEKQVQDYEGVMLEMKTDYEKDTTNINSDTRIEHINAITERYR